MASAANQKARQVVEEDLANVEFETSEDVEVIPTFDSMGLREDLLRGILAQKLRQREECWLTSAIQ